MDKKEIEKMTLQEFVLYIDSMTTKEFCDWQGCPHPRLISNNIEASADQFLQIDAIKHRLFVEKAKKENRKTQTTPTQSPSLLSGKQFTAEDILYEFGEADERINGYRPATVLRALNFALLLDKSTLLVKEGEKDSEDLALKSLNDITDEESIEVAKLSGIEFNDLKFSGRHIVTENLEKDTVITAMNWLKIFKYLESKGYNINPPKQEQGGKDE